MQKSLIITIGRQFGSGGHEIGEKLAKKLGIKFYDKELIKLIKAAYSEKTEDRFEKSDKNDDALKIDRVDFSGGKTQPAYEQYVPSAVPEEKHPFDFKA